MTSLVKIFYQFRKICMVIDFSYFLCLSYFFHDGLFCRHRKSTVHFWAELSLVKAMPSTRIFAKLFLSKQIIAYIHTYIKITIQIIIYVYLKLSTRENSNHQQFSRAPFTQRKRFILISSSLTTPNIF